MNHRIRRIDATTRRISTIAGSGTKGFSGDGGPALAAELSFPSAVAVDASGRVYFSDFGNNRIRVLIPGRQ
jgi:adhesin/invasin